MRVYEGKACPPPEEAGSIAIVVSRFNLSVTEKLLQGAIAVLKEHHVPDDKIVVFWVPGAFEIPTVATRLSHYRNVAAIICLGAVIRGETDHYAYINQAVSSSLSRLQIANPETPILFGILTCDTMAQALARCGASGTGARDKSNIKHGNKGAETALAALEMIDLFSEMPPFQSSDDEEDSDDEISDEEAKFLMQQMLAEMAQNAGQKKVGKKPKR